MRYFSGKTFRPPFFFLAILFLLISPDTSKGAGISITSSLGYDSNPGLYEAEEGSWFASYGLSVSRRLATADAADLKIAAAASFRDNFSLGDNYRLEAGPEISFRILKGKVIAIVSAGAAGYRDHLVEEDERNELFGGLGLEWFAGSSAVISLHSELRRLSYINEWPGHGGRSGVETPTGRRRIGSASISGGAGPAGGQGRPGGGPGGGEGTAASFYERQDTLLTLEAGLDLAPSPTLSFAIYGLCGRLESSIISETRDIAELGASVEKRWADQWAAELSAAVKSAWFEEWRRDVGTSLRIRLSKLIGRWTVFTGAELSVNDSTAPMESYTRIITECGVSWSY